jgi:glycogen debranching enzyme
VSDLAFIESIWPAMSAALEWIERHGDRDGDGFVEYERQTSRGPVSVFTSTGGKV